MRILSQNGLIDVPYEMSAIYIVDEMVLVSMVGRAVEGRVIARYSTPAKAEKAMEMLRNFRTITTVEKIPLQEVMLKDPVFGIFNECFDWSYWSDDKAGILKVDVVKKCDYFQFPQDDEIEV